MLTKSKVKIEEKALLNYAVIEPKSQLTIKTFLE